MAVVWSLKKQGKHYEVRSAGKTRRLYTDGVFHSQYHPERLYAGSIWDLLMLPALFYKPGQLKRILVLGAGGGAVLHLLRHYAQPDVIDAIDLDPVHLRIARQHFRVTPRVARLVHADGISWLKNYTGEPYDMIIDDMFGEQNGEPARAIELNAMWLGVLRKNLCKHGVLVLNTLSSKSLKQAACFTSKGINRSFNNAFLLADPDYHNAIGAIFRQQADLKLFKQQLSSNPQLQKTRSNIRKLKI